VIQSALAVDRTEVSKLIAVAKAVPNEIQRAIGRAPKVGRPRWLLLADAIADSKALAKVKEAIQSEAFIAANTNERLSVLLAAAHAAEAKPTKAHPQNILTSKGSEIARLVQTAKHSRIEIPRSENGAFVDFLVNRIPDLYELYEKERKANDETK